VPAGVARSFSRMIWRRSILLLVYGVGARSDVTEGVWKAVEKGQLGDGADCNVQALGTTSQVGRSKNFRG
jgi:hypothetical protein